MLLFKIPRLPVILPEYLKHPTTTASCFPVCGALIPWEFHAKKEHGEPAPKYLAPHNMPSQHVLSIQRVANGKSVVVKVTPVLDADGFAKSVTVNIIINGKTFPYKENASLVHDTEELNDVATVGGLLDLLERKSATQGRRHAA